ncbi:mandelate racemase/muconate lactonizing enzyme family protein [Kitasatospora sp. MBT63]|uniref:mandelate racemase/muconate lactonizing enzyme family protein n=1 Tax=Kitasatospora sp. MBT63 TaxID=1444768 RepID=UPI00053BB617|nr:mandelate racemase/muconate lactonizing enzyme family protein [Kitasatospora sp. MBT63]
MTILSRIELYHVSVPLPVPFRPAWIPGYPQTHNRFDLIRLVTDDGVEGWSAGPAMGRERAGLGDLVGPYLLGLDPTDIAVVQQRLREMAYLGLRNAWLEPAFWDVKARLEGLPLHRLLGAESGDIGLYASTGELRAPAQRVEEIRRRADEGFTAVKLRVHAPTLAEDIAQVEAVVDEFGDRLRIGVDANQGWRVTAIADAPLWDLDRARRFADACADLGVAWLEEPLPMDDYDALSELTAGARLPIAGGELHTGGWPELRMMIHRRCYDVFQPDAMFTGGIAQTLKVAEECRNHGVAYTPHTWTNGFGFAVNLQLMAAVGDREGLLEYPLDPPAWTPRLRDALLTEPFTHHRGKLTLPDLPGLGFTVDRAALRRWGRRTCTVTAGRLALRTLRDKGLRATAELARNRRGSAREART